MSKGLPAAKAHGVWTSLSGRAIKITKYTLTAALGLIALVTPNAVWADSLYTYAGNNFTMLFGSASCPAECSIAGSFTVPMTLSPSTTTILTPSFYDFSISAAGFPAWTNTNGSTIQNFTISTGNTGAIESWDISLVTSSAAGGPAVVTCDALPAPCSGVPFDGYSIAGSPTTTGALAFNSNDPGIWTATATAPVPEPNVIWLLGTGFLGLGMMIFRRSRWCSRARQSGAS